MFLHIAAPRRGATRSRKFRWLLSLAFVSLWGMLPAQAVAEPPAKEEPPAASGKVVEKKVVEKEVNKLRFTTSVDGLRWTTWRAPRPLSRNRPAPLFSFSAGRCQGNFDEHKPLLGLMFTLER